MSLRIAHVATERTWRGGEQQVFSLMNGLSARGHWNLGVVRTHSELAKRLGNNPMVSLCPWGEWDVMAALRLRRQLLDQLIDIVHAHTGHAVALAALATLGTSIPMVLTRRVDFRLSSNPFTRWKYGRAARLIAISTGVRSVLIDSGIPPEKIDLIPSGIDFTRFDKVRPVTKQALGWSDDVVVIGQVAALAPHKDQATFLRALALVHKKNPRIRGLLVGEGDLRPVLEKLTSSLGLKDVVKFMGFQGNPLDYLAGFDVFCMSSREEGLGTSILDAFALNVPVVATRTGGIPDLVQEGVTGFLAVPENPEALAAALERCLAAGGQMTTLLDRAASKAREFDVINTVTSVEAFYQRILKTP